MRWKRSIRKRIKGKNCTTNSNQPANTPTNSQADHLLERCHSLYIKSLTFTYDGNEYPVYDATTMRYTNLIISFEDFCKRQLDKGTCICGYEL